LKVSDKSSDAGLDFRPVEGEGFDFIVGRAVLTDVSEEKTVGGDVAPTKDGTKVAAGGPDEGFPRDDLVFTWGFTHNGETTTGVGWDGGVLVRDEGHGVSR
jgi:hypothetical protein